MPTLQAAMLCNAAAPDQSGLVSILGAFVDTVRGPELPIRHQLWLVARIIWLEGDFQRRWPIVVRIAATGQDDTPLVEISGTADVGPADPNLDPDLPAGSLVVLPLPVSFPNEGLYDASLWIDGKLHWQSGIKARLVAPPA